MPGQEDAAGLYLNDDKDLPHDMPTTSRRNCQRRAAHLPEGVATLVGFLLVPVGLALLITAMVLLPLAMIAASLVQEASRLFQSAIRRV